MYFDQDIRNLYQMFTVGFKGASTNILEKTTNLKKGSHY